MSANFLLSCSHHAFTKSAPISDIFHWGRERNLFQWSQAWFILHILISWGWYSFTHPPSTDFDRNDWFPLDAKKRNNDTDCWEDAEEVEHTASHLYQRNVLIFLIGREAEECALNQCFAFARKNKYIWICRFPAVQTSAWLWWRSITSNNMYIRVLDGWRAHSLLCFSSLELGWIYKVSKLFCALSPKIWMEMGVYCMEGDALGWMNTCATYIYVIYTLCVK